jgi:hypothetical protein
MAGSLDEFRYVSDSEGVFWIRADKSNVTAVNSTAAAPPVGSSSVPKNITPRYVLYRNAEEFMQRKIPVLTDVNPDTLPATITVKSGDGSNVTLDKSFYSGEKVRFVSYATDTAITTG